MTEKPNKQSIIKSDKQIDTKKALQKIQLIKLWKETRGHVTNMCAAVRINRLTFYNWLKKDPEFNQAIQDAEWGLNDEVRDALIQKIAEGSSTDIQFFLKNRHPDFKPQPKTLIQQNFYSEAINEDRNKYK